jgi:hypothetical protein
VIAFHYGQIFGETMIWHTPVINIKFLESSPLEVLLFETLSFCEKEGIEVFDLGEGDEPYKERFSNDQRSVFDLMLPVTMTGRAAKSMKDMQYKFHLREKAKEVGNFFLSGKEAFVTGVFKPKGYKWSPDTRSESGSNNLLLLENFASLVDFARCSGLRLNRRYYDNLRAGLAFCALKAKDEDWYSYCWLSRSDTLYIPETRASIDVAFDICIFDFGSTSRRQSCDIESLARQVAVKLESANIAAYVLSPDKALSKQISEAGFTRIRK